MNSSPSVALVTGSTSGIGAAIARRLSNEGFAVVLHSRSSVDAGHALASELTMAAYVQADLANEADRKRLVREAIAMWGRLDVLVNNAGILRDAFIAGMDESQWDAVIAVHLKGHAATLHHAAAYWKDQSKAGETVNASVINTASASGTFMPNAGQGNYGAAKAGIAALTLVAADELDRYGVRVNAIAPIARTRLTLATPGMGALFAAEVPEGEFDAFAPSNISPLVAYLAAADCKLTGKVYAVQGGAITELAGWHGVNTIESEGPWTTADLAERL